MIFDLVKDFADVLEAMPHEHPRRRILVLLDEAIRRDVHFIDRHPTAFFQCMWNTCWWYDCPEAKEHYQNTDSKSTQQWKNRELKLYTLLENWRAQKEFETPAFQWVRLLRPGREHLGTALRAICAGHENTVYHAVFFADSKRLASTGSDGTVRIWDSISGRQLFCWRISSDDILKLDIARDGNTIALADGKQAFLISTATGDILQRFFWSDSMISCVCYSPDGQTLAVGEGQNIRLIDTTSYRQIHFLKGHVDLVGAVAFSSDGQLLASGARGSLDHTMRVWCTRSGAERRRIDGFLKNVNDVSFSPDGRLLAGCSNDRTVRIWDIVEDAELLVLDDFLLPVQSVTFTPHGDLVTGEGVTNLYRENLIRFWNLKTGNQKHQLRGHSAAIKSLRCSPDGQWIASASYDHTIRIWSLNLESEMRLIRTPVAFPVQVNRSMSNCLATCCLSGDRHVLQIWNLRQGRVHRQFPLESRASAVALSEDGQLAVTAGENLQIWNVSDSKRIRSTAEYGATSAVAIAPNRRLIAVGADEFVLVLDAASGRELTRFHVPDQGYLFQLEFSRDNQWLVARKGEDLMLWNMADGQQTRCWRELFGSRCSFSPDGRRLVFVGDNGLTILDVPCGTIQREIPLVGNYSHAAFLSDNARVVVSGDSVPLQIWDADDGLHLASIEGFTDVERLAFVEAADRYWGIAREEETVFLCIESLQPRLAFPVSLMGLAGLPNDPIWYGFRDDHLWVMCIENDQ